MIVGRTTLIKVNEGCHAVPVAALECAEVTCRVYFERIYEYRSKRKGDW